MNTSPSYSNLNELGSNAQQDLTQLSDSIEFDQLELATINDDFSIRLINKLQWLLGIKVKNSDFVYSDNLEDLLRLNGFLYRQANLDYTSTYSQVPAIIQNELDEIVLIYSIGNQFRVYNPANNTTISTKKITQNTLPCYELYAAMPSDMSSLMKLFKFLLPSISKDLYYSVFLAIGLTFLTMFSPVLTSKIVGDVVPSGEVGLIVNAFLIGILVTGISTLLNWWQKYFLIRINSMVSLRIQVAAYDRAMKLPMSFIRRFSVGDFSSRLSDLQAVAQSLSGSTLSGILSIFYVIGYAGLMLSYDANLAFISFAVITVLTLVQIYFLRVKFTHQEHLVAIQAELYNSVLQSINAIPQIRINQTEPFFLKVWYQKFILATSRQFRISRASDYSEVISTGLKNIGLTLIYSTIVFRLINSTSKQDVLLSTSTFIVFTITYSGFATRLESLIDLASDLISTTAIQWKRALVVLQADIEPGYNNMSLMGLNPDSVNGRISLREISFAYEGATNNILENFTCEFKSGKFNVIFGPSGCGKSTIFNLLLRFYNPSMGNIHLDGFPINKLRVKEYRQIFGVILQKSILPAGSLRDAISGGLNYEDKQIWEALEFVNAKEEIEQMPMKLETVLSESGSNLSGGQRQRIAIARAIIRQPRILLEDEATSALDASSQKIITDNLKSIGITRIVIAHRLSVIKGCDHIVVISNKSVESEGEYQQLSTSSAYLKESLKLAH